MSIPVEKSGVLQTAPRSPRDPQGRTGPRSYTAGVNRRARPLGLVLALAFPGAAWADQPKQLPVPPPPPAAKKEPTADEKAARGVVIVERAGAQLCLGTVLGGDGRILTALSQIGTGNDLEVRYADGTTAKVKVGHHDRTWDLAFLVPQSGKWADGLVASSKDPTTMSNAKSFTGSNKKVTVAAMSIRGKRSVLGADDKSLDNVVDLGSKVQLTDLGSPVVDEDGKVVALVARGCMSNGAGKACTPIAFGVPISNVKTFLKNVPASAALPAPFLGIQGVADAAAVAKGVRVTGILAGSPAADAKLKEGDRVLAVAGDPVTTPELLAEAIKQHGIGEKVALLALIDGKYKEVQVTLRAPPDAKAAPAPLPAKKNPFDTRD